MLHLEHKKFQLAETVNKELLCYATHQAVAPYDSIYGLIQRTLALGTTIQQGYLSVALGRQIATGLGITYTFKPTEAGLRRYGRINPSSAFILKGDQTSKQPTIEKTITNALFDEYWSFTEGKRVSKIQLLEQIITPNGRFTAKFDVFTDRPTLVLAEIEVIQREQACNIPKLGRDVTEDPRYNNLAR